MDRGEYEGSTQAPPEEHWKDSIDLSHLDYDEFRDRVMKILEDN